MLHFFFAPFIYYSKFKGYLRNQLINKIMPLETTCKKLRKLTHFFFYLHEMICLRSRIFQLTFFRVLTFRYKIHFLIKQLLQEKKNKTKEQNVVLFWHSFYHHPKTDKKKKEKEIKNIYFYFLINFLSIFF